MKDWIRVFGQTSFVMCLTLVGCAHHDIYQQRTAIINAHDEAFQKNLKANRVEAAIHENQEIEATVSQEAEAVRKRKQPWPPELVDHEMILLKTATDAAVRNWLTLGRHFALNKQYNQARFAYQRIIDTYTGDAEKPYRERAAQAKRDMDILDPPQQVLKSAPGS